MGGSGTSKPASKCSVLAEYETLDDALERMREELFKVKAYTRDAYGNVVAEKLSKEVKSTATSMTACLRAAVRRDDYFRWEAVPATADYDAAAKSFFKKHGSAAAKIDWISEDTFSDGLDMWLGV